MVSLYYVQKFLFELNRDPEFQSRYTADRHASLSGFDLSHEEKRALVEPDIGLLFHLGVNGQILMHFAAFHSIEWQDYLQQMRDGLEDYGLVREGVYAVTGYEGVAAPQVWDKQRTLLGDDRKWLWYLLECAAMHETVKRVSKLNQLRRSVSTTLSMTCDFS